MEINLILMIRPHIVNRFMSLGENSLVAAYQGKGQLKSRPSGTRVVTPSFFAGRTNCPLALVICKPQSFDDNKVPKKILRIERHFFVNLRKNCFWPPTPRRAAAADFFGPARRRRRRPKLTGAPPPTQ